MSGYNHAVLPMPYQGEYKICWMVDYHYSGSRLRYPRMFLRVTDEEGALRFISRHDLPHWKVPQELQ